MKNVPQSQVVSGQPRVLPKGHEDLLFLNPNDVLITDGVEFLNTKYISTPGSFSGTIDPALFTEPDSTVPAGIFQPVKLDTPDLSDIEVQTPEQYYDAATKTAKYKVVVKIRNTSITKDNVQGVDARIFNPNA